MSDSPTGSLPSSVVTKSGTFSRLRWWSGYDFLFFAAWTIFLSLLFLAALDPGPLNGPVLGAMVLGAGAYLFRQQKEMKEIFFAAHIRPDSWLQFFRFRQLGLVLVALVSAAVLVLSLIVFLLTIHPSILFSVGLLMGLLPLLRTFFWNRLSRQFQDRSGRFLTNLLTTLTLGVMSMVTMIAAKWVQLTVFISDFTLRDADHMADYVIHHVNHSILWLQHLGRTLVMFELHILRAHLYAEGWLGHALLGYFLLPSTLAAFALPVLFAGILFLCQGQSHDPAGEHR